MIFPEGFVGVCKTSIAYTLNQAFPSIGSAFNFNGIVNDITQEYLGQCEEMSKFYPQETYAVLDNKLPLHTINAGDKGRLPIGIFSLRPVLNNIEVDQYSRSKEVKIVENGFGIAIMHTEGVEFSAMVKAKRRVAGSVTLFEDNAHKYKLVNAYTEFDYTDFLSNRAKFLAMWHTDGRTSDTYYYNPMNPFYANGLLELLELKTDFYLNGKIYISVSQDETTLHWNWTSYLPEDREVIMEKKVGRFVILKLWQLAQERGLQFSLGVVNGFEYKHLWADNIALEKGLEFNADS